MTTQRDRDVVSLIYLIENTPGILGSSAILTLKDLVGRFLYRSRSAFTPGVELNLTYREMYEGTANEDEIHEIEEEDEIAKNDGHFITIRKFQWHQLGIMILKIKVIIVYRGSSYIIGLTFNPHYVLGLRTVDEDLATGGLIIWRLEQLGDKRAYDS